MTKKDKQAVIKTFINDTYEHLEKLIDLKEKRGFDVEKGMFWFSFQGLPLKIVVSECKKSDLA